LRNPGQQKEDQGHGSGKNKQQSHTGSLRLQSDRLPAMRKRVFYLAVNQLRGTVSMNRVKEGAAAKNLTAALRN
jgi:hypothetical protein